MTNKNCSRCQQPFECKANDINNCQCNAVSLTQSTLDYIAANYANCLCIDCMLQLKATLEQENLSQAPMRNL